MLSSTEGVVCVCFIIWFKIQNLAPFPECFMNSRYSSSNPAVFASFIVSITFTSFLCEKGRSKSGLFGILCLSFFSCVVILRLQCCSKWIIVDFAQITAIFFVSLFVLVFTRLELPPTTRSINSSSIFVYSRSSG